MGGADREPRWFAAALRESFYLAHISSDHAMQDFMKFLRCRLQVLVGDETDARVFMFGDVNILSTGMDAALFLS